MAFVFQEDWEATLQERLVEPSVWREVNKVEIDNRRVIHNPYSTPTSTSSGTRGSALTLSTPSQTDESVTINDYDYTFEYIDYATLAQSQYASIEQKAKEQGETTNEKLDNSMQSKHASWTDFGDADIGGAGSSTTQIAVNVTNVPKIVNNLVQAVIDAKALRKWQQEGIFIIWAASDYSAVAQAAQNLGFMEADKHIKEGAQYGMFWGGVFHYFSNQTATNHRMAGVRKAHQLNIVKGTFGKVFVVDHPASTSADGNLSGVAVETRIDREYTTWNNLKPVLFDINTTT